MGWGFVWLMLVLKIPIAMLLYIVWWAIKQSDEPAPDASGEGGARAPVHPRRPLPSAPRRGPHGEPQLPAPPRTRTVVARSRETHP
jgi:hypothetical protein